MRALLALETGDVFEGRAFGSENRALPPGTDPVGRWMRERDGIGRQGGRARDMRGRLFFGEGLAPEGRFQFLPQRLDLAESLQRLRWSDKGSSIGRAGEGGRMGVRRGCRGFFATSIANTASLTGK